MPHFDVVRKAEPKQTFRVASVIGTYDLQSNAVEEHFVGDIDLPKDWSVGLIVGHSGTGKTTIAKELFPEAYVTNFEYKAESFLDDMPKECTMEQITRTLMNVGLASVPSWLKPYAVLSNGEKMRVDLARAILEPSKLFVFDEFTSVVDRQVAKVGSFAMQKAIRKTDKQFIAVTCHDDVEDWLLPDWVFDTNSMTFRLCEGQKKNRPTCRLDIYQVKREYKQQIWRIFRKYHYLSDSLPLQSKCYALTIDGKLCSFIAASYFPHPKIKNIYHLSRVVVHPDFQGLGISYVFMNEISRRLSQEGHRVAIITSNPKTISVLKKSKHWNITRFGRCGKNGRQNNNNCRPISKSIDRITCSAIYTE